MFFNATSLNKRKLRETERIANESKCDLIFVTETWFNDKSVTKISGYDCYFRNRVKKRGGGVCIYVKDDLVSNELENDQVLCDKLVEQIWVELRFDKENVLLGCIYRPPNTTDNLNERLNRSIAVANEYHKSNKYSNILIAGDFNHNSIDWSESDCPRYNGGMYSQAATFINNLRDNFLYQVVTEPTFQKVDMSMTNTIDLIITNDENRIHSLTYNAPIGKKKQNHLMLKWKFVVEVTRMASENKKKLMLKKR